MQRRAGDPYAD